MATNYIVASAIKTGAGNTAGDLSNVNISALGIVDGDIATVHAADGSIYNYKWSSSSALTEDVPRVVKGYYNATGRWLLMGKIAPRPLKNLIINSDFKVFTYMRWAQTLGPAITVTSVSNGTVTTSATHNLVIGQLIALGINPANDNQTSRPGIWIVNVPGAPDADNLTMYEVTDVIDSLNFKVDSPDLTNYAAAAAHSYRQVLLYDDGTNKNFYHCLDNVASAPDPPDSNYSLITGGNVIYPVAVVSNDVSAIFPGFMTSLANDGTTNGGAFAGKLQSFPGHINGKFGGLINISTTGGAVSFNFILQSLVIGNGFIQEFAGQEITFGCYLQGANAYLELWSDSGGSVKSTPNSTSNVTWHEITATIPSDAAEFAAGVKVDAVNTTDGNIIYWSQPIVVTGDYVGEGNYLPDKNKLVINKSIPLKPFAWNKTFSTLLSFSLHFPRETFYCIASDAINFGFRLQISRADTTGIAHCLVDTSSYQDASAYADLDAGVARNYNYEVGNYKTNMLNFSITLNGVASVTMYAGINTAEYV